MHKDIKSHKQLYMPDPNIPLHEQRLLSVTPPEQKAEADWELPEPLVHNHKDRYQIGDEILLSEVTPESEAAYDENKARINAATAKNAATVRQLEKEQHERFRAQYPEYVQPEPVRSDSYNKIRRIIG
jgi:hypothetical protein